MFFCYNVLLHAAMDVFKQDYTSIFSVSVYHVCLPINSSLQATLHFSLHKCCASCRCNAWPTFRVCVRVYDDLPRNALNLLWCNFGSSPALAMWWRSVRVRVPWSWPCKQTKRLTMHTLQVTHTYSSAFSRPSSSLEQYCSWLSTHHG